MPRVPAKKAPEGRHDPLYKELAEDDLVQKFGRVSKPGKRVKSKTGKNHEGGQEEVSTWPTVLPTLRGHQDLAPDARHDLGSDADSPCCCLLVSVVVGSS